VEVRQKADCWVVSLKRNQKRRKQVSEGVRCLGYSDTEATLFLLSLNLPP